MASVSSGPPVGERPEDEDPPAALLTTRLQREGLGDRSLVLTVEGDIDLCTLEQFSDAVWTAFEYRPHSLVLDLGGVGFLSIAGLHVLVALLEPAEIFRCALSVRNPSPAVRRLFELLALPENLRVGPCPRR
jgi:anti-anti-sigma factor